MPELSVKSWMSGAGVQFGWSVKLVPFQGVAIVFHRRMSLRISSDTGRKLVEFGAVVLASMSLRRNVLPAGTALAAKLRVGFELLYGAGPARFPIIKTSMQVLELVQRESSLQAKGVK